ncbi:MAG: hypothetical protein ACRC3J_05610 [Culicoidibacterales bacterium]
MTQIILQPVSGKFSAPSSFELGCTAISTAQDSWVTFQWEYADIGTSNWSPILHPSAETENLIIPHGNDAYKSAQFRCVITEHFTVKPSEVCYSDIATMQLFDGRRSKSYKTSTRKSSHLISNLASNIKLTNWASLNNLFPNSKLGEPTLVDAGNHVDYKNVQSALVDLAQAMAQPVGGVLMNTTGQTPNGVAQQSSLTFSGAVKTPDGNPAQIGVYGLRVEVQDGATASQVRDAVFKALEVYDNSNIYLKNLTVSGDDSILYTHLDRKSHPVLSKTAYGITITGAVTSPALAGYGTWVKFNEETVTYKDVTTTVHSWRRTA